MPKILFVTPSRPFPPDVGGRQRSALLARALERVGEVHLLIVDLVPPPPADLAELRARFPVVEWIAPRHRGLLGRLAPFRRLRPRLVDRLSHNLGRTALDFAPDPGVTAAVAELDAQHGYDLFIGRYLKPSMKAGLDARRPVILDVDDLEVTTYHSRLPEATRSWEQWTIRRHIRELERLVPPLQKRFGHLWIASESDRELVSGHPSVGVLPNVMYSDTDPPAEPLPPPPEGAPRLMVIASWNHRPNSRGLTRFLERSWPTVLRGVPEAELEIVGSMMTEAQRDAWSAIPNVIVSGRVDSVRDAYSRCVASLCPVWDGGGTKIKILESLELGRTAVVADYALRGYESTLLDGEHLFAAKDDDAFAEACVRVLRDPRAAARMGASGREAVVASYSREAFSRVVGETVRRVLGAEPGHAD